MDPVLLTVEDGVARLRFNRADRLNALDKAMSEAFLDAAVRIAADRSVRVVMLSGAGRTFMAGGDLGFLRSAVDRAEAASQLITPMHAGLKILREAGVPSIAVVQGAAVGAGMSLAMTSDFVIASSQANFSMGYIRVAATPDCGGSWALPRLVGARRALELALLGDTLSASAALQMGLINTVVPPEELDQTAHDFARRIAALPAGAADRTRRLLDLALSNGFSDQLDLEQAAFVTGTTDQDFAEALACFFAGRSPIFARDRSPKP